MLLPFNDEQLREITRLREAGLFPEMYRYIRGLVDAARQQPGVSSSQAAQLATVSTWMGAAAQINANQGFHADFVRGAVSDFSLRRGSGPISDAQFQEVSDRLARTVAAQNATEWWFVLGAGHHRQRCSLGC